MDQHQRRIWGRMLESLDSYDEGKIDLSTLASQLKGFLEASDLRSERLVCDFQNHIADISEELRLRSQSGGEAGPADNQPLPKTYGAFAPCLRASTTDDMRI